MGKSLKEAVMVLSKLKNRFKKKITAENWNNCKNRQKVYALTSYGKQ